MWHSEHCLKAVVLNDWTASFGVTHGSHISYTQRVTILMSTNILEWQKADSIVKKRAKVYKGFGRKMDRLRQQPQERKEHVGEERRKKERRDRFQTLISRHLSISSRQTFFPPIGSCQQNIFVSVSIVKWSKYMADLKEWGRIFNCEMAGLAVHSQNWSLSQMCATPELSNFAHEGGLLRNLWRKAKALHLLHIWPVRLRQTWILLLLDTECLAKHQL